MPSGIFKDGDGATLNLRQALDELARCCGESCCERLIRIPDKTTGKTVELYFDDGVLKYDIDGTTYTVSLTV